MRPLLILATLLLSAPLHADPLKSAACDAALARLQSARETAPGSVETRRQEAARACLGLGSEAPVPRRANRWALGVWREST